MNSNQITDPRSIKLKAMKGNDLKVLVAMVLLGAVNIGNKAIKMFSGLHYTTVQNSLDNLSAMGMVTKTHRFDGWQVTQGGLQMVLPSDASHIFCDSEAIINIDNSLITSKLKDSNTNNTETSTKICDSEIVKSLVEMGIYNPKATDLACLDHVDREYIDNWKLALDHGKVGKSGQDNIGLAIILMSQNAPAPKVSEEEINAEICTECGHSSLTHGGDKRCGGNYLYMDGKRVSNFEDYDDDD